MITRRLRDLPIGYLIPNKCPVCGLYIGNDRPSALVWVTDGTAKRTYGTCCMKCAKLFVMQSEDKP